MGQLQSEGFANKYVLRVSFNDVCENVLLLTYISLFIPLIPTILSQRSCRQYQVGTQEQEEEPVPVITNYVTDTNPQQVPVVIAPPAAAANNGQGKDIATSVNRAAGNQAQGRGPVCSIGPDPCCSSDDCGTNCCNFQYGCVEKPTDLPWMTQYLEDFCM